MKYAGHIDTAGMTAHAFASGYRVGNVIELDDRACVRSVIAYMEGVAGVGGQQLRALIYDDGGELVAMCAEAHIADGAPGEWVEFGAPPGLLLAAGSYVVELQSGRFGGGALWYALDGQPAGTGHYTEDVYDDGPSNPSGPPSGTDDRLWLLAIEYRKAPAAAPDPSAAGRALDALAELLADEGITASRDADGFDPSPIGVLLGLPSLTGATLGAQQFEVPVLVVSGDPVSTSAAVDRLYAEADAIALVLAIDRYRPTTWGGSSRSDPLAAIELLATVTVETQEG